jgi:hypothetical protein
MPKNDQTGKVRLYRVRVEIDVEAESANTAAIQAYTLLRDPAAMPWYCDVFPDGDTSRLAEAVDLNEVLSPEDG